MPDKVVIRLINRRPSKPDDDPGPQPIIVYHWNRIFAALAVVVLLLAGVVAGVRHLSQEPDGKGEPSMAQASAPTDKSRAGSPGGESPAASPQVQLAREPQPRGSAAAKPEPGSRRSANAPAQATGHADASQPSNVLIRSQGIRSARLTSNIVDGMAVDDLGSTIPMSAKGLLKVFLLTETAGLKGRLLFHDWYWKDKLMAHAKVPVTRNVQNSVTSKFIDRIMTGPWKVKVVDDRKKVYAEVSFEVR